MRGVEGQISLAKGIVTFRNVRGFYGESRFTDIDGSYVLAPTEKGKLDLQLRGDVDLAELKEQVKAGLFSARAAKIASSLQDLAGRSKIDFALKRSADAALQFDGKIALENVRVRYDDHSFSDVQGDVTFTPNEIKTDKLRAHRARDGALLGVVQYQDPAQLCRQFGFAKRPGDGSPSAAAASRTQRQYQDR